MIARIAYVTAGTVGAGHLVRGLAIQRALARRRGSAEYKIFGPPCSFPGFEYSAITFDREALVDPARAKQSELARALEQFAPDLILVDMFWAPLRYILPIRGAEAWLLIRKAPPEWLRGPPRAPFDSTQYARILAIEPGLGLSQAVELDPIVIGNRDELHPRGTLRKNSSRFVAVVHAGEPGELAALEHTLDAADRKHAHLFDLRAAGSMFPLALYLDDADLIVSGAGYNSYWEARWLGRADRTRFVPFLRRIDDQKWRVDTCGDHTPRANGADTLAREIIPA